MYGRKVAFGCNDLSTHAQKLVALFDLKNEADVPVESFTLNCDGAETTTEVGPGKYKTALLLLYLAQNSINGVQGMPFSLSPLRRQMVREYYTVAICDDAENNPETPHTTVRALLKGDCVTIFVKLTPDH